MNREILFRGKRLDTKQWVCGNYNNVNGKAYIFPEDAPDSYDNYQVDPSTVGQYTEMKDKNGNKIFEGDIIKFYRKTAYVVFRPGEFYAVDNDNTGYFIVQSACEVVGNVHDSPELVEGGEE